jgi:TonB family protein|tara:strand:- start:878 stop:1495 length:618 start_codon:yes stop_codon:yes gene_type:complete
MEVKSEYLIASFFSFLIHALIILYLMDFFYSEKQIRPVLSQTVDVNLIFEEEIIKPKKLPEAVKVPSVNQVVDKDINIEQDIKPTNTDEINISINDLIKIDKAEIASSSEKEINQISSMIVNMVESAWVKPKNIQDGLVCDLRLVVNRNGRIISVSLIKSSGNIRFDNSAMKAVNRVESFNFYNKIPNNLYADNFKKIVITFNPS